MTIRDLALARIFPNCPIDPVKNTNTGIAISHDDSLVEDNLTKVVPELERME